MDEVPPLALVIGMIVLGSVASICGALRLFQYKRNRPERLKQRIETKQRLAAENKKQYEILQAELARLRKTGEITVEESDIREHEFNMHSLERYRAEGLVPLTYSNLGTHADEEAELDAQAERRGAFPDLALSTGGVLLLAIAAVWGLLL